MLELILVVVGSLLFIVTTLIILYITSRSPTPPPPPPPPPNIISVTQGPRRNVLTKPLSVPSKTPLALPPKPKLMLRPLNENCTSDSDCGAGFYCEAGRIEYDGKPFENEVLKQYANSIDDVVTLDGKLYFLLDGTRLGVSDGRGHTQVFDTDYQITQLVTFHHKLYLRGSQGTLLVLEGSEITPIAIPEPVRYISSTPDGTYLYINNKLFNGNYEVVREFPTREHRVFFNDTTYLTLGSNPSLVQENQVVPANLPSPLKDAAFTSQGEVFLLGGNEERYRRVVAIGEEPFMLTHRRCVPRT